MSPLTKFKETTKKTDDTQLQVVWRQDKMEDNIVIESKREEKQYSKQFPTISIIHNSLIIGLSVVGMWCFHAHHLLYRYDTDKQHAYLWTTYN